jgi:zinc transporter 5/7
MFVEILVGYLTNSLGMISDAGHMFFDNASLVIGLYASYMAKLRRDEEYTFGYAVTPAHVASP